MSNFNKNRKLNNVFTVLFVCAISFFIFLQGAMITHAEDSDIELTTSNVFYVVNPLYAGVVTEDDLNKGQGAEITPAKLLAESKCTDVNQMASAIREGMVNRTETVYVYYELPGTSYTAKELISIESNALDKAVEHTGKGTEGDYLKWGYSGLGMQVSYGKSTGNTIGTFTYYFTYYTNGAQESQVTSKVNQINDSLGLSSKSEIDKINVVYKYVVDNVKYSSQTDNLKYSCYGAAVNNSAVCQGYSLLIYRLLNDAGVDCRLIAGTTSSGAHGWNIIKIGNLYYNVDATWDAGKKQSEYKYYLKCDSNFNGHTRWTEYSDAAFTSVYPMSASDYDIASLESNEIEKIEIENDNIALIVGGSEIINITTTPLVEASELSFSSSNKKIATVDSEGEVTAKKTGTCVITISSKDGSVSVKCYITVKNGKKVSVKSVRLSKKKLSIKAGKTYKLTAKVKPNNATNKSVILKSSNKKIATVSKSGVIKAKKKGTCVITVITKDGKKKAKCKVTVK